ncbi:MAG: hypothetical protein CR986_07965 [Ignavibacteriae bacterium]|nr:MAG: hypothetical protein CR986_07965 [Ignavibacteriota bacterium]
MKSNPFLFLTVFIVIILLIDFYSFRGVKKLTRELKPKLNTLINILFWAVPIILIISFLFLPLMREKINPAEFLVYFHFIAGTLILFYVPKLIFIVFNLIDDIILLLKKIFKKEKSSNKVENNGKKITRSQFLTKVGIIAAGIPFLSITYGIGWGRFNITIRKLNLAFPNLPESFNGLKVVQISDFHIGSFLNHANFVKEVVEKVNSLNPDLILFTGDFVNNVSGEMDKFLKTLSKLKSKIAKISILGNHDYGEYINWKSEAAKESNLSELKRKQRDLGFELLLNSNKTLKINDDEIEIIGVENWGLPPFPQYGDLQKAMQNVKDDSFKILLSHDPTHWDEQVLRFTNIDLTLSGHTHGAQFGIEIPGWRWSPVNIRYKRWGGLYKENNQLLNVNTGIGFIGFPGRVGMPPEITLIELSKKS